MEIGRKVKVLLSVMYILMSATTIIAPVFSHATHEEGNVNYPGSWGDVESIYDAKGIWVDNYITIVDVALCERAQGTADWYPPELCGVDWWQWNPDADIDVDGFVTFMDLVSILIRWGLNYQYSEFEYDNGPVQVNVVAPRSINVGAQFNASIEIMNVDPAQRLDTYEFTLSWNEENAEKLEAISVVGGGFISEAGVELGSIIIDNDEGYLYVGDLGPSQSGSGTLAIITFECLDDGKVTLHLSSRLFDIHFNSIPHVDHDTKIKQED